MADRSGTLSQLAGSTHATTEVIGAMTERTSPEVLEGLAARTGLSRRDVEAFVESWERAGRPGTLEDFLGFVPEQRAPMDDAKHA